MRSAIPVHERPARNVLIAVSNCAKMMRSRVERVSQFSARPAASYIECSTRSLRTGNVGREKGLKKLSSGPAFNHRGRCDLRGADFAED